ncbi:bone morphogenetic protein 8A-like [Patiria miniata]|uniref:TGF-beta family profile domain-containing protein n=1 Tax=Patiria miniata TaxID=46514 RepID=A0A913ZA74_PATMI|nr:bone morphogenetic protein 8A-like [Patiria miniata]
MPFHAKESPSPVLVLVLCLLTLLVGAQRASGLPSPHHRTPAARAAGGPLDQSTARTGDPASRSSSTDSHSREERRLEAIKESILATLHMEEPPSPEVIARAKANLSPEDVERAYTEYEEKVRELSETDENIPTRTPIQTPRREIRQYHSVGSSRESVHFSRHLKPVTLFFGTGGAVSSSRRAEDVADGKLKLYLRPHPVGHTRHHTPRGKKVACSIFMVRRDNTTVKGRAVLEGSEIQLLDSKEVSLQSPGWKTFHITEAVRGWLDRTDGDAEELALVVTAGGRSADNLFYLEQGSGSTRTAAFQPRVDVLYREPPPVFNRERRQANHDYNCQPGDGVTTCCRYEQHVSYSELGWSDWIIQPTSYKSYQCSGGCPANFRSATAYSRIKSLMHTIDPDDWNAPCCAPVRFSPTVYLYMNGTGGFEVATQTDSVVEECKCL